MAVGVMVSTRPDRGQVHATDFQTDDQAVQFAYDLAMTDPKYPRTLILDAPDRPFAFAGPLDIWQSHCRVTSTGGVTITPAEGYTGPLITSGRRDETELGEDKLICNVVLDNLWLNGHNQSLGIKLRHLQLATIHDIHVRRTNGPGLWLCDYVIECLFNNIILSDECGSVDQPALLLQPESSDPLPGMRSNGNVTVNSACFVGLMIHFPTNAAVGMNAGPAEVRPAMRHRKVQFSNCFFHGHHRQTLPLVTISDALECAIIGSEMLNWNDDGPVIRLGNPGDRYPVECIAISHCAISSKPDSRCVGISIAQSVPDRVSLLAFGNTFGSFLRPLMHAVDWGEQPDQRAAWGTNAVHVYREPHIGRMPRSADQSPFQA